MVAELWFWREIFFNWMEERRLAMILSHISVKRKLTNNRLGTPLTFSYDDCRTRGFLPNSAFTVGESGNRHGPMDAGLTPEGCSAKDAKTKTGTSICCSESLGSLVVSMETRNKGSVDVQAKGLAMEGGECSQQQSNVTGSCAILSGEVRNKGTVHSQMARNRGIVNQNEENCVFCEIIRGQAPAFKLYEDETCLCILDLNPLSHGHSLIIPKTHFSSLEVTPPPVAAAMCAVVPILSNAIMEATCCDSFNLLVNSGAAAGQVIFHTHFHIIPRSMHDKLWRSENVIRRPLCLNQETSLLAECIRGKLSALQT